MIYNVQHTPTLEVSLRKKMFGVSVHKARMNNGISLRKFASKINISPSYLSRIERDSVPPPEIDKIESIAKNLDIDSDDLIATAKKIPRDIISIIHSNPRKFFEAIRRFKNEPEFPREAPK